MKNERARMLEDIRTVADELTRSFNHFEPYEEYDNGHWKVTKAFRTTQPPLLEQLAELVHEALKRKSVGGKSSSVDAPVPIDIEAFSKLLVIEREVVRWTNLLNLDIRTELVSSVQQLVSMMNLTSSDTHAALLVDLRRWHCWAATLTGLQSPLIRPYKPCPSCGRRTTLVINPSRRTAFCAAEECLTTWSSLEELKQSVQLVA